MAKLYKATVYVLDLNGSPENANDLAAILEYNKYPEFLTVGEIKSVDIGEWDDNHELNKAGCDHEKYFK